MDEGNVFLGLPKVKWHYVMLFFLVERRNSLIFLSEYYFNLLQ